MTTKAVTMPQAEFVDRLKRALKFTSKRTQGLPQLEAVQIRVVGAYVTFTACDRYLLGVFRWTPPTEYGADRRGPAVSPEPFADQFTVDLPADAATQIVKMFPATNKRQSAIVTLTVEDGDVTVTNTDGLRFATRQNEKEFPKVDSMLRSVAAGDTVESVGMFDPALMARALTAMTEPKGSVTYWQSKPTGPMVFRSDIGLALVMPRRPDSGGDVEPCLVDGWAEALGL